MTEEYILPCPRKRFTKSKKRNVKVTLLYLIILILASETDFAEDGSLYPVIEYWCEDSPLSMSIRISHDYSIATISFAKELSLPFIYPLKKGKYIR